MKTSHSAAKIKSFCSDGLYNSLNIWCFEHEGEFYTVRLMLLFRGWGLPGMRPVTIWSAPGKIVFQCTVFV